MTARLEVGLARLARTGYFKPSAKENIRVQMNDVTRTATISIRVEEIGQQRASLIRRLNGQFGSTPESPTPFFDLLNPRKSLSAQLEGGPESLQIMLGFSPKRAMFGTRASLAFSVSTMCFARRFATS